MRLRIEPPTARRTTGPEPAAAPQSLVLPVRLQRQERPNWCWAAIAASLGQYYGTRLLSQQEVASSVLGCNCSTADCDADARLDEALRLVGCFSHWSPGRPTFERLQNETAAGRPVCLCLHWESGGAHYAVVTGYYAATREIHVEDPLHGPSVQLFDAFPARYRGTGAAWSGTFWTNPP